MGLTYPLLVSWVISVVGGIKNFTLRSNPVQLRYGEVHNRNQYPNFTPLPKQVVERYAKGDKLMAIQGFDVDIVRLNQDGTKSQVKLSDHYLHHYILYFGNAKSMNEMFEMADRIPHMGHMLKGCHAMKGAGVHMFKAMQGERRAGYDFIGFGSAAGAEYRHNPQKFQGDFRLILKQPEVLSPTMHIINTNEHDNTTHWSLPKVSPLLECPCTPQRVINVHNGTIDGKKPDPPFRCSPKFDATGNPSCHLSTYVGGWRCCEDGMFLIDTAKQCKNPDCSEKPIDEVHMEFTFHYEDALPEHRNLEAAACCDATGDKNEEGFENIEYDIPACPSGTPVDKCLHVAESVQSVGYFGQGFYSRSDLVDLAFAAPHLHYAGMSLELIDHETNKTLCSVHNAPDNRGGVMYGHGTSPGDEDGYLVGLTPCTWGNDAPRMRRDHLLRMRAVYNSTQHHTGVMSLWLMQVSPVSKATSTNVFV